MARLGPDGHVRFTSGVPSASDILTPISALHPISSGLPPAPDVGGKRAWPYHLHYAQEEMFVILEGEGTLRYDGDTYPIRDGDVIFTPTGPGTAHQIVNTSNAELRYLALSSMTDAELCEYPDSGKIGAGGRHDEPWLSFLARAEVDYFDGEEGEP